MSAATLFGTHLATVKREADNNASENEAKKIKTFAEKLEADTLAQEHQPAVIGTIGDQKWARPQLPTDWSKKAITFQQIDAEEGVDNIFSNGQMTNRPYLRLFGVTGDGHSILCDVLNFSHYLYVLAPRGFTERDVPALSTFLRNKNIGAPDAVEIEMKQSIWGYYGDSKVPFLKLVCADPRHVTRLRSFFESGQASFDDFHFAETTFDNISYAMRCSVDCGIVGMSWITLPKGKYSVIDPGVKQTSPCTGSRKRTARSRKMRRRSRALSLNWQQCRPPLHPPLMASQQQPLPGSSSCTSTRIDIQFARA